MKKILYIVLTLLATTKIYAQENPKIKVSGYLETYYTYDFNQPTNHNRPSFVYSHNRHNEVNVNLGFIKANYESEMIRANMALMVGTYANANLAAEPGVLKNIFEANVGVKLSKTANLWLDAGIFGSHIGFESAIAKDCWVLTRNIASENTPYYEAGAKLTYGTANGRLTATLLYLNGWQRITRADDNNKPAGGVQLTYKPVANFTLNYSNYLGQENIENHNLTRFYHNFYAIAQLSPTFGVTLGLDYGTQQKVNKQLAKSQVLSPVFMAQYKFASKWAMAGRFEYYQDKDGVFITTGTSNGFKTKGYSLNVDYAPMSNATLRLEGKLYDSRDQIFLKEVNPLNRNTSITASLALSF